MSQPAVIVSLTERRITAKASGAFGASITENPIAISVTNAGVGVLFSEKTVLVNVTRRPVQISVPRSSFQVLVQPSTMRGPQGLPGQPGGAENRYFQGVTVGAPGQTTFTLDFTAQVKTIIVQVNNSFLGFGVDFTSDGDSVTLLPHLGYQVAPSDFVQISFIRT